MRGLGRVAVLAAAGAIAACATSGDRPPRPALINHPVFFKLRDARDADELIRQCDTDIATIPGVVAYYCGRPFDSGRASVDLGFDVGLFVGFESAEDYAAYLHHPQHLALVDAWRLRTEWLRVHDVIDESP